MKNQPSVQKYYEDTLFDFRTIWGSRDNLACHFGFYDEQANKHHDALNNMNRALADLAKIQPSERVLDAGCGVGGSCFWLSKNRRAIVTGISIVEKQLKQCRKNAARRTSGETKNVDFQFGDFCKMPFPDESFDVVWAIEAQCHAENKADFYREARRVLRPGGRLVVADYIRTARPLSENQEKLLAGWLNPWAISDIDTREEHQKNASAAGFSSVEIRDVTPQVRVSLRNLHHLCEKWMPFGRVLRFLNVVNDVRLENVRASVRQFEALENGAWFYTFILCK